MAAYRTALEEETHEIIKLKRSNSEYTLGSRQWLIWKVFV